MLDLLLPRRCVLCRREGSGLCPTCAATLPPAPDLGAPPGLRWCRSLLTYDGTTRELVAALKFHNHRDAVSLLGRTMAALVDDEVDLVTWAPTSRARRVERGFDQAEQLARAVARSVRRPCRPTLVRPPGAGQTGRTRAERLEGPVFRPTGRSAGRILVVDDVRTTGSTLCAAADALVEAGTGEICGLTLAVTLSTS